MLKIWIGDRARFQFLSFYFLFGNIEKGDKAKHKKKNSIVATKFLALKGNFAK